MSTEASSINVSADLGILEVHEVAEVLNLRHSTVLDLKPSVGQAATAIPVGGQTAVALGWKNAKESPALPARK